MRMCQSEAIACLNDDKENLEADVDALEKRVEKLECFADEAWRELSRIGEHDVFTWGYLEQLASELGLV